MSGEVPTHPRAKSKPSVAGKASSRSAYLRERWAIIKEVGGGVFSLTVRSSCVTRTLPRQRSAGTTGQTISRQVVVSPR